MAEACAAAGVDAPLVSVIFHGLIEDLGGEALQLAALFPAGSAQRALLRRIVRVPKTSPADLEDLSESLRRYPA